MNFKREHTKQQHVPVVSFHRLSESNSHTVSFVPEVWQQPVEARVHRRSAGGVGGVGLQGQVEQETRH